MKAVAHMERTGVPVDTELYGRLVANWDSLKEDLIAAVDEDYGVYEAQRSRQIDLRSICQRDAFHGRNIRMVRLKP